MRRDRGQALVEFALVVPTLLLIVFGIIEFGVAWNHKLSLNDATRAASRAATTCRFEHDPPAAIAAAYDKIADTALPGHVPVSVAYAGGSCTAGTEVTVTGRYPVKVSILGLTPIDTTITSVSVSTVE